MIKTIRWDVELNASAENATHVRVPLYAGETLALEPRLCVDRRPVTLATNAVVRLYVRNLAGQWGFVASGAPISTEPGRVSVPCAYSMLPSGTEIPFRVLVLDPTDETRCYSAAGALRLLDAPGPNPATTFQPATVIDWAAVEHDHIASAPFARTTPSGVADIPAGSDSVTVSADLGGVNGIVATVQTPDASAPMLACCVADVSATGFAIVLSATPTIQGYRVAWRAV